MGGDGGFFRFSRFSQCCSLLISDRVYYFRALTFFNSYFFYTAVYNYSYFLGKFRFRFGADFFKRVFDTGRGRLANSSMLPSERCPAYAWPTPDSSRWPRQLPGLERLPLRHQAQE